MIYISTSCIKAKRIYSAIKILADEGFSNIEISGGTEYYNGYEKDLIQLQNEYNLNYLIHNYFPPPSTEFVLNLASQDESIFKKSIDHLLNAIALSKLLKADRYSFHAGFFLDLNPSEIGKDIKQRNFIKTNNSIERFCKGFNLLKNKAGTLKIYLENNVYSRINWKIFKDNNPFMLTNYKEYLELKRKIDFNLLLDVAHLKVSSNSLNLDFDHELENMMQESDYIHISENDGLEDQNNRLLENGGILSKLKNYDLRDKIITLEIYKSLNSIKESYNLMNETLNL
jgi:sugar phosphate isomerase/epimerase